MLIENDAEKLEALKQNLQMMTRSNDSYLILLLAQAESLMQREGIRKENTIEYIMAQIDYAAFLFRKRGQSEQVFPRHLRWELNNLLFSQQAR